MSNYTVTTTRVTAVPRPTATELLEGAIRDLVGETIGEWVGSSRLDRLAREPFSEVSSSAGTLAVAERRLAALTSTPLSAALVRRAAGPALDEASSLLTAARATPSDGAGGDRHGLAGRADALLRQAAGTTADLLRVDERRLAADATHRALRRTGYSVERATGQRVTGLVAHRGDTLVAILAHDGGVVEVDWAGCADDACRAPMAELTAAIAEEGLECETSRTVDHGDERGGQLIARAAAAAPGQPLVVGLVAQHERGVPSAAPTSALASTPVARRVAR